MGMPWSPMQAVQRIDNNTFEVWDDDYSYRVAIIRKVSVGSPPADYWRSVTGHDQSEDRQLIGYFPSLRFAAHVTWRTWITHTGTPADHRDGAENAPQ